MVVEQGARPFQVWPGEIKQSNFEPESSHFPAVIFSAIYLDFRPDAIPNWNSDRVSIMIQL